MFVLFSSLFHYFWHYKNGCFMLKYKINDWVAVSEIDIGIDVVYVCEKISANDIVSCEMVTIKCCDVMDHPIHSWHFKSMKARSNEILERPAT